MEVGKSRKITYEHRACPDYYPRTLRRITCLYVLKNWDGWYDWDKMYKWRKQGSYWTCE